MPPEISTENLLKSVFKSQYTEISMQTGAETMPVYIEGSPVGKDVLKIVGGGGLK